MGAQYTAESSERHLLGKWFVKGGSLMVRGRDASIFQNDGIFAQV